MYEQSPQLKTTFTLDVLKKELLNKVKDNTAISQKAIDEVLERIQDWTSEEPFLTRVVCDFVVRYAGQVNEDDADLLVDQIVRDEIVNNWQSNAAAIHLQRIYQTLLAYERRDSLLIAYIKIFQRGKVRPDNSPEQDVLLRSGLVSLIGSKLRVSNLIYRQVFDLDWVEAQLPGITKPVTIISRRSRAARSLAAMTWPLKVAAAAGCLALVTAGIVAYVRESNGRALATQSAANVAAKTASEKTVAGRDVDRTGDLIIANASRLSKSDVELFDDGLDHGQNGRWVLMLREFCSLEKQSVYFAPAQDHLAQWQTLFPEGVETALETMTYENLRKGDTCLVTDAD